MKTFVIILIVVVVVVLLVANKVSRNPFLKKENGANKDAPESMSHSLIGTWAKEFDNSGTLGDEIEFSSENGVQKFTARYYKKTLFSAGTWTFMPAAPNQYAKLLSGELTIIYDGGGTLQTTTITMNDRDRLGVDDHGDVNDKIAPGSYTRIK